MCASSPSVQKAPDPPPPVTPVTEDQSALDARTRERQRAALRQGRASTILAGDTAPAGATAQGKTALGM